VSLAIDDMVSFSTGAGIHARSAIVSHFSARE